MRSIQFQPGQVGRIHDALQHDFETNSLDNAFVLNQISRRYENKDLGDLGAITEYSSRLTSLTGEALHAAAMKYLDPNNYVKVILMPDGKN